MKATPQLDELFTGLTVTAEVLDDLRDKSKAGQKLGFPDLLTAVLQANAPLLRGVDGDGRFKDELQSLLEDRETAGHVGQQLGYAIHDVLKDLRDPAN